MDKLYRKPWTDTVKRSMRERAAWIVRVPGPGVERYFGVRLGWSVRTGQLPHHRDADGRRFTATSPIAGVPGGVLDLGQIEQQPVIGCIQIPCPWDRVAALKPAAPRAVQREVTEAAAREAAALTDEEPQGRGRAGRR